MRKPPLLLIGCGRIGRLAAGLLARRWSVHVLERRRGLRLPRGTVRATADAIGEHSVVVFAVPADELRRILTRQGKTIRPGAFVADLCAVKSAPAEWMAASLRPGVSYAGLHPLFGPDSATEPGPAIAVCPGRMSASCRRKLTRELRALGLKPVETTPAIHDRTMASTLFLTQIIGLASVPLTTGTLPFGTPSSALLRVIGARAARNSPDLLREIVAWNPSAPKVFRSLLDRLTAEFRKNSRIRS